MPSDRITLKHVSEAAGVSVQTASHVLNTRFQGRYRAETRNKVLQVAQLMGYRPNAAARSMLTRRSHIVGLLVPIGKESWFFQLDVFETLVGINKVLAPAGYVTSIIPVDDLLVPGDASRAFREQMLDGVVVMGVTPDALCTMVETIAPVAIWCDTNINRETGCVRRDESHAATLVMQHIIAAGYRRIVWVRYKEPADHYSCAQRHAVIRDTAAARGLPLEVIFALSPSLRSEVEQLLPLLTPDTAVITENHHFAQAVGNIAAENRLAAGRDFGLASCDHSRERASVLPQLSRVMLDRAEVGTRTAEMLLQALGTSRLPRSIMLQGQWYPGATTPGPSNV